MSFRTLLAIVLVVTILVAMMFFILSIAFLRIELNSLIPPALVFEIDRPLRMLLIGQAVAMFLFALVLAGGVFWAIGVLIAKPLRSLVTAMEAYAKTGERISFTTDDNTPKEVRSLAVAFDSFIDRVEESHKHDVEISRVKSDFISTAAHQLRTPLTAVRWALEALEKEELTENQKALVASAVTKSKDLVGIVGTLLDISSIESGKAKYTFAPTDMKALVSELTHDFVEMALKRKISLFFATDEGAIPLAKADRERVKWVLNNLIENALRYTPENGTVRVSLETSGNLVYVKVKDSGIGIEPGDRANIFERFYRGGNAIAKENQGNGLGLYIARTIATDHGGDLHFEPNVDSTGTTFVFSLPIARS